MGAVVWMEGEVRMRQRRERRRQGSGVVGTDGEENGGVELLVLGGRSVSGAFGDCLDLLRHIGGDWAGIGGS